MAPREVRRTDPVLKPAPDYEVGIHGMAAKNQAGFFTKK